MHQLLFVGTTASLMPTSEKFCLALGRNGSVQKLRFWGVGFNWCNPNELHGEEVGCLRKDFSFMPLSGLYILFSCNYGIFYKTFGFFIELCFGIFPCSE